MRKKSVHSNPVGNLNPRSYSHSMWRHPPFFSIFLAQFGHLRLCFWMTARLLSSSSIRSLIRAWYSSQVSLSCHGLSHATQALAPHVLHTQMSGLGAGREGVLGGDFLDFLNPSFFTHFLLEDLGGDSSVLMAVSSALIMGSSGLELSWTWPARQLTAKHQRQPGVFSAM